MGGLGLLLVVIALVIKTRTARRNNRCTAVTTGSVIDYSFRGDDRIAPIIEFEASGTRCTCEKKFNGIKVVQPTSLESPSAWEDDKGYLHIRRGIYANLRKLAEEMWPLGSKVEVRYDPNDPRVAFVDRPITNSFLTSVYLVAGIGVAALGVLMFFVIGRG